MDANGNGIVDGADTLVGTGTYSGTTSTVALNTSIPMGTTATFLVVYQFSNTAPTGNYMTQLTGASGTNSTGSVLFSGLPANGANISIATATPTFSFTPTSTGTSTFTPTSTVTKTPTPIEKDVVTYPYPNPVTDGPVNIDIKVPGPSTVQWSVFTVNFRKIVSSEKIEVDSSKTLSWNLKDKNGVRVADGLYYVRIEIQGPQPLVKVFKILVLH